MHQFTHFNICGFCGTLYSFWELLLKYETSETKYTKNFLVRDNMRNVTKMDLKTLGEFDDGKPQILTYVPNIAYFSSSKHM